MQSTTYPLLAVDIADLAKRLRERGYQSRPTAAPGQHCAIIGPAFTLILSTNGQIDALGDVDEAFSALEGLVWP